MIDRKCECEDIIEIDESTSGFMVVRAVTYCDHMGPYTQHIISIPLGLTREEWNSLWLGDKVKVLQKIVPETWTRESDKSRLRLLKDLGYWGRATVRRYSCPYCDP